MDLSLAITHGGVAAPRMSRATARKPLVAGCGGWLGLLVSAPTHDVAEILETLDLISIETNLTSGSREGGGKTPGEI